MNINGIGVIFARGRGVESFEKALHEGWKRPEEINAPSDRKTFAYKVDPQTISDRTLLKKMRRADKLSRMAVLSASEALRSSGLKNINKKSTGIITASAFGAHVTTFDFLNDILDYGETNVSPTLFSNSVHNAAASYISSALDIRGPTLTVTQFHFSFQYALQLAQIWLNEERCDYILVGIADQCGDVMRYVYSQKLTVADDGGIKPFNFKPSSPAVPGEGSIFFLVSRKTSKNVFCKVKDIRIGDDPECKAPADLNIIDTGGMLADESVYMSSLSPDIPAAAYSPLFGSMMTGSAFNCTAGALMLKNQVCYANPVMDNPHGINILNDTKCSDIELIRCIKYNCYGEKAVIYLSRK